MASSRNPPAFEQSNQTQDIQILQQLNALLASGHTADTACDDLLEQLYALTKSPSGARIASSLRGPDIALLGHYGFNGDRIESRRPALRCLNNILVLAPSTVRSFVEAGLLGDSIDLLKSTDPDDEFLAARLLSLCSTHSAADLLPHLEHGSLVETINANMARHAAMPSPEPTPACTANLQLISVLIAKHEAQAPRFFVSLTPVLEIFERVSIPSPPLEPPMSQLIGALAVMRFNVNSQALVAPGDSRPPFNDEKLVRILDLAFQTYQNGDRESRSTPLISLLYYIARDGKTETKQRLQTRLLPSDQDRARALGRGDSLPHRLIKAGTEAVMQDFKKVLAHLFLELSAGDPKRLVRNVGFGCGVGLLRILGMPVPPSDVDDGESEAGPSEVNPITGQRRDMEPQQALPEMTREEREREAERLFVLFERLRATGVVDVENPVATAARSGRIQEMDSDAPDD